MYRNLAYRLSSDKKKGIIDLFTWDQDGNRVHEEIEHNSWVTYEVPFTTNLKSIFDTNLKRKFFDTTKSRWDWVKNNKDKVLLEESEPVTEFLNGRYYKDYMKDDFRQYALKTHYLDIEIQVEDEFPDPNEVKYPINLITVWDSFDKIYHTWSLEDCTPHRDDSHVRIFETEKELLKDYLKWHSSDYPDVITTWNGRRFDIPYICNRVKKVLGNKQMLKLSPVGKVTSKKVKDSDDVEFTIACVTHWDYYQLYKYKFQQKSNGSFSLGNVGEHQLGLGKIQYDGTFKDLYTKDFQKFFEYNVRDVEIIVKLEEKLRFLELSRTICNMGLSPHEKIYSSIPYIINGLWLYTWNKQGKIFPKCMKHGMSDVSYEGAYVFPTKSGFYKNGVATIDLNSLYPNTMIAGNMSPETKVGTFVKLSDTEYTITLTNGVSKKLSDAQFNKLLETKCICTDNNTLFLKHEIKMGIIPGYCEDLYADRKTYKKKYSKALRAIRKLEKTSAETGEDVSAGINRLRMEATQYDVIQYQRKILLNSIYGMFGTKYASIYDPDIAQSITLNGQFVIQSVPDFINKHMEDTFGSTEDVIIAGDTDSVMFDYSPAVLKLCEENNKTKNELTRTDVKELCHGLDEFVDNKINPYCQALVNKRFHTSHGDRIVFGREKFCMEGMFFSKKHYILHVVDNEGHATDSFTYKGIEIAKNELPVAVKNMLRNLYESIHREDWDQNRFSDALETIWKKYSAMSVEAVSKNSGWNTSKESVGFLKAEKGAGAHVKSALFYNQLINKFNLTRKYDEIKVGGDVQWCYINPDNPYGIEVIGFNDKYPEEFKAYFSVDYNLMFEKNIVKSLGPLMEVMNWIPFNPNNRSAADIFNI